MGPIAADESLREQEKNDSRSSEVRHVGFPSSELAENRPENLNAFSGPES